MNLAHLNPEAETLFERLDDAGARTACTPFLIYRGRHRHQVSLDGLLRRAVDATRLKFRHHTWGPGELFYGDLYASREVPCKPSSIPGSRDGYSACCAAELVEERPLRLPPLLAARQRQLLAPPRAAGKRRVDRQGRPLLRDAARGRRADSTPSSHEHALILLADHAQTPVHRGLPLAELLGREWSGAAAIRGPPRASPARGQPDRARGARLPAAQRGRAGCAAGGQPGADRDRGRRPGLPAGGTRRRAAAARRARGARRGRGGGGDRTRRGADPLSARATRSPICAGGAGSSTESSALLEAEVEDGRLRSEAYPDPLARVWSALTAPNAGDFVLSLAPGFEALDWGGVTHAGGGSHGSLHAGDSLGPLLFVGCGPRAAERARAVGAARRCAGGAGFLRGGRAAVKRCAIARLLALAPARARRQRLRRQINASAGDQDRQSRSEGDRRAAQASGPDAEPDA